MKNMQLKILLILSAFLSIQIPASHKMFRFQTTNGPEYQEQFEKYMSWEQSTALWDTGIFGGIIGILIAFQYLSQPNANDALEIIAQYPYAKKWYDAMNEKYPQAQLQEKNLKKNQFRESPSTHNINFLSSSLQEINSIYKKQLAHQELTEEENLAIKKYEFLLLSQAGYIENNGSTKLDTTWLVFTALTYNLIVPFLKLYHPIGGDVFEITSFERGVDQFKFDYRVLSIMSLVGSVIVSGCLNMHYENVGDTFASTECDDESLEAIIQTCKNEKNYAHRIKNIQQELIKRQQNQ